MDLETQPGRTESASGRRGFRQRALAAGMAAVAVGSVLGAGAVGAQSPAASGGAFDIQACAGKTVRIALVDGERDDMGLRDKQADIEAATGMKIELTTMALDALNQSIAQNLRAPESAFDIVHILGFTVAGTAGANLLEPLNAYVNDPSKTPADYDFADFPAGQLQYTGYFDPTTGEFGGDNLYMIPGIHSGSAILFYRKDLLGGAGQPAVPTTWAEYLAAAKTLTTGDVAGSVMVGNDRSDGIPRRLVHPLHHHGRAAHQRQQERQDPDHQPG